MRILTLVLLLLLLAIPAAAAPSFDVPFHRRADRLAEWADERMQPGIDNCQSYVTTGIDVAVAVIICQQKVAVP